jgi:putative membrane protein
MRLRKLHSILVISAVCAVPLSSMAQTSSTANMGAVDRYVEANTKKLDGSDKRFLENAAQNGQAEIEGSKLAQKQSTSADVKAFAGQMLDAHTALNQELVTLASKKGVEAPTEPSLTQKVELKALNMTDKSFDTTYADRIGVKANEKTLKLFQEAASDAKDPEVKAFAQKHIPDLEKHLQLAKALQSKVESEKQ